MKNRNILVIGMGVIGLPTAFMFAKKGFNVQGYDNDYKKIDDLRDGSYILPADLDPYKGLVNKRLKLIKSISYVGDVDYIIVCVGVGIDDNKNPIFEDFDTLIAHIGYKLRKENKTTVCFETTLPPGTMINRVLPGLEVTSGLVCGEDFHLVYAPERVTLTRLVYNIQNLPRVVGGYSPQCKLKGVNLYSKICKFPVEGVDLTVAEMVKLTENTYRDVNIAFANEIAAICDRHKVDFLEVRHLVNDLPDVPGDAMLNPKRNLHYAGSGVGGYCLPKDPWLLKYENKDTPYDKYKTSIIETARKLNDETPGYLAQKAVEIILNSHWVQDGSGYDVLLLGYTAIKNTGDCRNTPAVPLIGALAEQNLFRKIHIYDPYITEYCLSPVRLERIINSVAIIILVTPHTHFADIFDAGFGYQIANERVVLNSFKYNILKK